jgi:hypothetical protein
MESRQVNSVELDSSSHREYTETYHVLRKAVLNTRDALVAQEFEKVARSFLSKENKEFHVDVALIRAEGIVKYNSRIFEGIMDMDKRMALATTPAEAEEILRDATHWSMNLANAKGIL